MLAGVEPFSYDSVIKTINDMQGAKNELEEFKNGIIEQIKAITEKAAVKFELMSQPTFVWLKSKNGNVDLPWFRAMVLDGDEIKLGNGETADFYASISDLTVESLFGLLKIVTEPDKANVPVWEVSVPDGDGGCDYRVVMALDVDTAIKAVREEGLGVDEKEYEIW